MHAETRKRISATAFRLAATSRHCGVASDSIALAEVDGPRFPAASRVDLATCHRKPLILGPLNFSIDNLNGSQQGRSKAFLLTGTLTVQKRLAGPESMRGLGLRAFEAAHGFRRLACVTYAVRFSSSL